MITNGGEQFTAENIEAFRSDEANLRGSASTPAEARRAVVLRSRLPRKFGDFHSELRRLQHLYPGSKPKNEVSQLDRPANAHAQDGLAVASPPESLRWMDQPVSQIRFSVSEQQQLDFGLGSVEQAESPLQMILGTKALRVGETEPVLMRSRTNSTLRIRSIAK